VTEALARSITSLRVPNYRRYFTGQVVSLSGNWCQIVAETWLVLKLTGSGVAVGVTASLQFLPILLFGALGGVLADRVPKRRLLIATQFAMAAPAVTLFALTATGAITVWMVFALVFLRGAVNAIDNPTRQSFVIEMVGPERVTNAVGLNSVIVHSARIAGPAVAGVVIATAGVALCFLINAASFAVMVLALRGMDARALRPAPRAGRGPGALRAALAYVRGEPRMLIPLALMGVVGTFTFNFQVLLPLLATFGFGGGASAYALLTGAMGVGSVVGALAVGARRLVDSALLAGAAVAFGVATLAVAAAPALAVAAIVLPVTGACAVTFAASVNSFLQLAVEPSMRGRVMALYSVVFLGSTPLGAPLMGWVAQAVSPRAALAAGGAAAIAAGLAGRVAFARAGVSGPEPPPASPRPEPAAPSTAPGCERPGARAPRDRRSHAPRPVPPSARTPSAARHRPDRRPPAEDRPTEAAARR
jgi:MFS family permease